LNACVAAPVAEPTDRPSARRDVGIDLGLEELVATSTGEKLSAPQFYRGLEAKLAIAQRAGKRNRVRAIHAGLGIRAWTCSECGTVHDRDVNAAKNILAAGRRRLAEGIPAL
jgi:transposase